MRSNTSFYALRYRKLIHRRRIFFISGGTLLLIGLFIGLIYLKPASASGRVLIWKVSAGLCKENMIRGNGLGSFKADYMPEQAKYLSSFHAAESERMLAGNTNHSFNEYLLLLIEQGLIGIALFLLLLVAVFRSNVSFDTPALLAIVSIAIFSCFSYPFKYAFVWFMTIYCLASLNQREVALRTICFNKPFLLIILFILCFFRLRIFFSSVHGNEFRWLQKRTMVCWITNYLYLPSYMMSGMAIPISCTIMHQN